MDIKLPSSTADSSEVWDLHEEFVELAAGRELILKMVITGDTSVDDIVRAAEIIKTHANKAAIVLQPVTPIEGKVQGPDAEMMLYFTKYIEQKIKKNVMVLGQFHKKLGIR